MHSKFTASLAALPLIVCAPLQAMDGAIPYRVHCANCHGVKGEGRQGMKAPLLRGTQLDENRIVTLVTKGKTGSKVPHEKGVEDLNDKQARAIAEYIRELK